VPELHRAQQRLIAAGRVYDGIWRLLDAERAACDDDIATWPEHVYLPMERAAIGLAMWHAQHAPKRLDPMSLVGPASMLAGLATWRVTQGIYRFDPDIYAALVDTPVTGNIPGELFARLPEWCLYLETPGLKAPLVGTLDAALTQVEADWREAISRGNTTTRPAATYAAEARATFAPILSLLLYLCSDRADLSRPRPSRPTPTKTKQGPRHFPPAAPCTWDVGLRIGAALRHGMTATHDGTLAAATGTHASPRPHIRRAHWHTYLVGAGRTDRRLKWIPPIPINVEDLDQLPATIHPVR
jgi:hypothetical protein